MNRERCRDKDIYIERGRERASEREREREIERERERVIELIANELERKRRKE